MTDAELRKTVLSFRRGMLNGRSSTTMCFAVCSPLQGYLAFIGVNTTLEEVCVDGGEGNHFWLRLPDGRIVDPTADQFTLYPGRRPREKVYIGQAPRPASLQFA